MSGNSYYLRAVGPNGELAGAKEFVDSVLRTFVARKDREEKVHMDAEASIYPIHCI
jgi:hypothetical protein